MKDPISEMPPPSVVKDTVFENSFKAAYPWMQSTGFRPFGLQHRGGSYYRGPQMGEDFLVNSRLLRQDREAEQSRQGFFFDAPGIMSSLVGEEPDVEDSCVDLPSRFELPMSLKEAMVRRRSVRRYTGEPVSLEDLATLLRLGGGVSAKGEVEHPRGGRTWIHFRFTPSAGTLYPIELQVAALIVHGLDRGLYRYEPIDDRLPRVGDVTMAEALLASFAGGGDEVITFSRASAALLLVAKPWRAMRKYGARGIRHLFIEAGQIAQNIHLACAALGLGSVDCSSIYDDEAHEALRLDGRYTFIAHAVVIGRIG